MCLAICGRPPSSLHRGRISSEPKPQLMGACHPCSIQRIPPSNYRVNALLNPKPSQYVSRHGVHIPWAVDRTFEWYIFYREGRALQLIVIVIEAVMLVSSLIPREETGRPILIATKSYVYLRQDINNKLEEGRALQFLGSSRRYGYLCSADC